VLWGIVIGLIPSPPCEDHSLKAAHHDPLPCQVGNPQRYYYDFTHYKCLACQDAALGEEEEGGPGMAGPGPGSAALALQPLQAQRGQGRPQGWPQGRGTRVARGPCMSPTRGEALEHLMQVRVPGETID